MADLQYEDGKVLLKDGTDISGELSSDNLKSMKASALRRKTDMPEQGTVGFFQYVRDAVVKGPSTISDAFKNITGKSNDEQTEITKETAKTTQKTTDKKSAIIGNDKTDTGVKQESKKSVPEKAVEAIHKIITEAGAKGKVDISKWNLDRLYGHKKEISA